MCACIIYVFICACVSLLVIISASSSVSVLLLHCCIKCFTNRSKVKYFVVGWTVYILVLQEGRHEDDFLFAKNCRSVVVQSCIYNPPPPPWSEYGQELRSYFFSFCYIHHFPQKGYNTATYCHAITNIPASLWEHQVKGPLIHSHT